MDVTAIERIETLLEEVQGLKPVFTGVVDFCRESRLPNEVDERFKELTEYSYCVLSPVRVRAMLEEAGALLYEEPEDRAEFAVDGSSDASGAAASAAGPEVDGDDAGFEPDGDYLSVTERPVGRWLATEEGLAVVDAINPYADLLVLLREEPECLPVYRTVLEALAESPQSIGALGEAVNEDPVMKAKHRLAPYLIKRLEEAGAVEFRGAWTLTEAGRTVLSEWAADEGVEA